MSVLVDASVLVDYLCGRGDAGKLLDAQRSAGALHASEITRVEIIAGIRPSEEAATRALLGTLIWHPLDDEIAEEAGALGRRWLPSHRTIGMADLIVAATAIHTASRLLTRNIGRFPMFADLQAPY